MVYYKDEGDYIYKYDVPYDEDALNALRKNIIDKCSLIEHVEYESDYDPVFNVFDATIKNFKSQSTGKIKEYFEEDRIIYHYSYDRYNHPYLVKLIDEFMSGDTRSLAKIINYDSSKEVNIDEKIKKAENDIKSTNIDNLRDKLDELDSLKSLKNLNSKRESTDEYYKKLLSFIHFDLISAIKKEDLYKVMEFLGLDSNINELNKKYIKK